MNATCVASKLVACRGASVVHGRGTASVQALENVDLDVGAGECLALWGRSGSGKTTLFHILGGLIAPTAGTVQWHNQNLATLDSAARTAMRRRGIAYVFQGINLLPHFSAYENVAFALRVSLEDSGSSERATELLELVGLTAKLDALPSELSGGEAQRVAIARALGQQPELLLCDEPTGQLDSDTGARVLDLIDVLHAEFGFSLVVATHDINVAARYGRTVELSDGRVVADVRS